MLSHHQAVISSHWGVQFSFSLLPNIPWLRFFHIPQWPGYWFFTARRKKQGVLTCKESGRFHRSVASIYLRTLRHSDTEFTWGAASLSFEACSLDLLLFVLGYSVIDDIRTYPRTENLAVKQASRGDDKAYARNGRQLLIVYAVLAALSLVSRQRYFRIIGAWLKLIDLKKWMRKNNSYSTYIYIYTHMHTITYTVNYTVIYIYVYYCLHTLDSH